MQTLNRRMTSIAINALAFKRLHQPTGAIGQKPALKLLLVLCQHGTDWFTFLAIREQDTAASVSTSGAGNHPTPSGISAVAFRTVVHRDMVPAHGAFLSRMLDYTVTAQLVHLELLDPWRFRAVVAIASRILQIKADPDDHATLPNGRATLDATCPPPGPLVNPSWAWDIIEAIEPHACQFECQDQSLFRDLVLLNHEAKHSAPLCCTYSGYAGTSKAQIVLDICLTDYDCDCDCDGLWVGNGVGL
jgi:hypothetical protein